MLLGDRGRQRTGWRKQITCSVYDARPREKRNVVGNAGVLVRAKVICALVVILAAIVGGVYLGEWPLAWGSSDLLGWIVGWS